LEKQPLTYLTTLVFLFCFLFGESTDVYAQRARKHREGILKADSIRAQNRADSLALLDTLAWQRQRIEALEAPVDTALLARKNDSIQQQMPKMEIQKKKWTPNANSAIWLSLAIPGAGQIYNHKYWKLPIIYGGFVGCIYALTWNGQMYKDYSQAYQDIMSDNPANDSYMDFLPLGYTQEDVFNQLSYFQDLFQRRKDVYRRQRDLSIFAFIGVYLLSVVDAYVDAELSNFDISNDLSMTWQPAIFNDPHRGLPQGIGLRCSINF